MPRRSLDPKDYPPAGGVWTYEEYMKLPVENTRYEVIAGDLYITPTPPLLHQAIAGPFLAALYQQVEEDYQLGCIVPGPIDVLFGEGDFIEPMLCSSGVIARRSSLTVGSKALRT